MPNEVASEILDSSKPASPEVLQKTMGEASTDALPQPTKDQRSERISSNMEILIRREAAALNRENAAKAREAELEAKLARISEFESVKENPKKALEMLGLNYDELTKSILADGEIPPEVKIKRVEEKFDKFREEQTQEAEKSKRLAQAQAQEREASAISGFKSEITTYLKDNDQRYELIKFEGQEDLVFEVIDEHYNRTAKDSENGVGKVMSISEAADKVEQHLEQKYQKAGKETKKVQTLWGAIPKETQKELAKAEKTQSQSPRTLTNQMSATPTKRNLPMTDDERVQKAIAYAASLRR